MFGARATIVSKERRSTRTSAPAGELLLLSASANRAPQWLQKRADGTAEVLQNEQSIADRRPAALRLKPLTISCRATFAYFVRAPGRKIVLSERSRWRKRNPSRGGGWPVARHCSAIGNGRKLSFRRGNKSVRFNKKGGFSRSPLRRTALDAASPRIARRDPPLRRVFVAGLIDRGRAGCLGECADQGQINAHVVVVGPAGPGRTVAR